MARRRKSVALARRSRNESRRERRSSGGVSTGSTPRASIFGGIGAFSISRRSSPDSISELAESETCTDRGEGQSSTFGQLGSMTVAETKRHFGRQPTEADLLAEAAVKRERLAASTGSAGSAGSADSAGGPPPGTPPLQADPNPNPKTLTLALTLTLTLTLALTLTLTQPRRAVAARG